MNILALEPGTPNPESSTQTEVDHPLRVVIRRATSEWAEHVAATSSVRTRNGVEVAQTHQRVPVTAITTSCFRVQKKVSLTS